MLISPPFLPPPVANESDEAYVTRCMSGDSPGRGAFPVSAQFGWHGGLHLTAPGGSTDTERVRAIADGTVVFKRERTPVAASDAPTHPLYYDRGYTSDGCVVIQHETEIGASAAGAATTLKFYSIYLHLHSINDNVKLNRPIYRKDEIGQAGNISGEPNRMHFEIVGDDACVKAMTGREVGARLDVNGRTDAVFGDIYFRVPGGAVVYAENPQTATRHYAVKAGDTPQSIAALVNARVSELKSLNGHADKTDEAFTTFIAHKATAAAAQRNIEVPAPFAKPVADLTGIAKLGAIKQDVVVRLAYQAGQGKWTATLPDGQPLSAAAPMTVDESDAEYDLYKNATHRYSACARAGFELLRFGRVIGPDALHADDVNLQVGQHVHFREIPCLLTDGTVVRGFVDLKAAGVGVYSEADMPPWERWWQVQDFADGDSRCDSAGILDLLGANENGEITAAKSTEMLRKPDVQLFLKRSLVKIPTEWEKSSIEKRWGWLKQDNPKDYAPFLTDCMSPESFAKLKAFLEMLCFWEEVKAATGLPAVHWHFEPREFIKHFRKCAWISAAELDKVYPDSLYPVSALARINETPSLIKSKYKYSINILASKYFIITPTRRAHFFGQGAIESMFLSLMIEGAVSFPRNPLHESFASEANGYYNPPPGGYLDYLNGKLGNIDPGDGPKFRGRGMKQLTGRENYSKYWVYKGWLKKTSFQPRWWSPNRPSVSPQIVNPQQLSVNSHDAIEAGCWYWEAGSQSNHFVSINNSITDNDFSAEAIERVTRAINGGVNGLQERSTQTLRIKNVFSDKI